MVSREMRAPRSRTCDCSLYLENGDRVSVSSAGLPVSHESPGCWQGGERVKRNARLLRLWTGHGPSEARQRAPEFRPGL
jgi:hypothetical protein